MYPRLLTSGFTLLLFTLSILISAAPPAHAQMVVLSLSCDSLMQDCDTVLAEYYAPDNLLLKKVKIAEEITTVNYQYNASGQLIGKKHTDRKNQLIKYERYTLDSEGEWIIDTIFGKNDELLLILTRQRTAAPGVYQIQWYFKNELAPMTTQLVQENEQKEELSNSTCYSPDNCITTLNRFNNGRKTAVELWVLTPDRSQPVLRETEELFYDSTGRLTLRVRFLEPDHTILERNKYLYFTGTDPLKRPTGR